jgi:hypothetical protein
MEKAGPARSGRPLSPDSYPLNRVESETIMILIAGGQNDPNLAVLVQRLATRGVAFRTLLVGADTPPSLRIDVQERSLELNGELIRPTGYFIRQDVFLYDAPDIASAHAQAHNWFHAIRGWAESCEGARVFNRRTSLRENNKIYNLIEAINAGLRVPRTIATNDFQEFAERHDTLIQKPVAGGEYTTLLSELIGESDAAIDRVPRFVQPRLDRPEYRIYRIGLRLMAFELQSPELDYRQTQTATIKPVPVPDNVGSKLLNLCDRLELDFAAADFMVDENGELNFLEVNSQPMFAAFDRKVDGSLSDAIIDHLEAGGSQPRHAALKGRERLGEYA